MHQNFAKVYEQSKIAFSREDDIRTFISHSSSVILDSLTTETTKYILEKLLSNFKQMISKVENPFEEASGFFEKICDYENPSHEQAREGCLRKLIEISHTTTHYSYEEIFKILLNHHILFVTLCYRELYSHLFQQKVSLKKLLFSKC